MPFTRPSSQDQDQDQDRIRLLWDQSCNKTKVSDHITDTDYFLLELTWLLTPQVLQQQRWRIACILVIKRAFQRALREIPIPKYPDMVSHNLWISGLKNGQGLQSLGVGSMLTARRPQGAIKVCNNECSKWDCRQNCRPQQWLRQCHTFTQCTGCILSHTIISCFESLYCPCILDRYRALEWLAFRYICYYLAGEAGQCSRRSHLEHLKYSKTIRRLWLCPGPHWESLQLSPRRSSWWRGGWPPSPSTPTLLRLFGSQAVAFRANLPLIIPHFQVPSDANDLTVLCDTTSGPSFWRYTKVIIHRQIDTTEYIIRYIADDWYNKCKQCYF